jgi:hypothetical protein
MWFVMCQIIINKNSSLTFCGSDVFSQSPLSYVECHALSRDMFVLQFQVLSAAVLFI